MKRWLVGLGVGLAAVGLYLWGSKATGKTIVTFYGMSFPTGAAYWYLEANQGSGWFSDGEGWRGITAPCTLDLILAQIFQARARIRSNAGVESILGPWVSMAVFGMGPYTIDVSSGFLVD